MSTPPGDDARRTIDLTNRAARISEVQILLAHAWSRLTQQRLSGTDLVAAERGFAATALRCCETLTELGVPEPLGLRLMAESILQRQGPSL